MRKCLKNLESIIKDMAWNKDIYVIADLHLDVKYKESTDIFVQFLRGISSTENILLILGDFFDYWIGDDHNSKFYHKLTGLLKQAHDSGLKVLFMHGNRDFLIGKKFAKQSGVNTIKDPFYLEIADKKILFSHGDLFCTDDKSYQLYRKFVAHNKVLRFVFRRLPLFLRQKAAKNIRSHSYAKNSRQPNIDVNLQTVEKYRKNCDAVIHGHTHKMAIHNNDSYTRYVLGDWFKNGNYIKISKSGLITQVSALNL